VRLNPFWLAKNSGAKATAVHTLRDCQTAMNRAKRLDCGVFTAAFGVPALLKRK
jgi:hypothetical protein